MAKDKKKSQMLIGAEAKAAAGRRGERNKDQIVRIGNRTTREAMISLARRELTAVWEAETGQDVLPKATAKRILRAVERVVGKLMSAPTNFKFAGVMFNVRPMRPRVFSSPTVKWGDTEFSVFTPAHNRVKMDVAVGQTLTTTKTNKDGKEITKNDWAVAGTMKGLIKEGKKGAKFFQPIETKLSKKGKHIIEEVGDAIPLEELVGSDVLEKSVKKLGKALKAADEAACETYVSGGKGPKLELMAELEFSMKDEEEDTTAKAASTKKASDEDDEDGDDEPAPAKKGKPAAKKAAEEDEDDDEDGDDEPAPKKSAKKTKEAPKKKASDEDDDEDGDDDGEDDEPAPAKKGKPAAKKASDEDDDEDDEPAPKKSAKKEAPKKKASDEDDDEDDEDDEPAPKKSAAKASAKKAAADDEDGDDEDDDEDDDEPAPKKSAKKEEKKPAPKKGKPADEDDEDGDE